MPSKENHMEKRETLELVVEQLEERIAPGVVIEHNNNGFGNGPESGLAPGNSGDSPHFGDNFNANFGGNGPGGPR
jgi:hypothetical protein